MDQSANPAPAPISASVTAPRLLLKNELGVLGVDAGGCCCCGAGVARASSRWDAGDNCVSWDDGADGAGAADL